MRTFVSYSRHDRVVVDRLVADLHAAGVDVWLDRADIVGGDRWQTEIAQGLAESDAVVLVMSRSSMASEPVTREVAIAYERGKRILPVRVEACELTAPFEYALSGVHRIDAIGDAYAPALDELVAALRTGSPSSPPGQTQPTTQPASSADRSTLRRRSVIVGAVAAGAAAVGGAVLKLGRGGSDPNVAGAQVGASSTSARAGSATATAATATTATATTATATTAAGVPAPPDRRSYTDRVAWYGTRTQPLRFEVRSAALAPASADAQARSLVLDVTVTNPGVHDAHLVDVVKVLVDAGGAAVRPTYSGSGSVPARSTTRFDLRGEPDASFALDGARLVWGDAGSNQAIVPLDGRTPVEALEPRLDAIAVGSLLDCGRAELTVGRSMLWWDVRSGHRGDAVLEVEVTATFASPDKLDYYDEITMQLQGPDGTVTTSTWSEVYGDDIGLVISDGRTAVRGVRFEVPSPVAGAYVLRAVSRRARLQSPEAQDAEVAFVLA